MTDENDFTEFQNIQKYNSLRFPTLFNLAYFKRGDELSCSMNINP